jgi:hypothetical protein
VSKIVSVGAVDAGDDPDAVLTFWKRKFTAGERDEAADAGQAMPGGGFPIVTAGDLRNAVAAYGRAKNPEAAKRHIIRRARALGRIDLLPGSWNITKMTPARGRTNEERDDMAEFDLSTLDLDEATLAALEKHFDDRVAERVAEALAEAEDIPEDDETVAKMGLSEDAAALFAKQETELADTRAALDAEIAKRRDTEMVAKAAAYRDLLGDPDEVGPVLRRISDAAPEEAKVLEGWLDAIVQKVDLSELFKLHGENDTPPGPTDRDVWVAKHREEHPDVSVIDARAEFWRQNPDALEAEKERG